MKLEKVRKPYWGSQLFKWAENSRYNYSLTHKKFILMLNRERLGIGLDDGNHVQRWLRDRSTKLTSGLLR